jgi:serine/threonine protein kinase
MGSSQGVGNTDSGLKRSKSFHAEENSLFDNSHDNISTDDFEILKVVGDGYYGKVYAVKDKRSGAIYAMKAIKKDRVVQSKKSKLAQTERNIMQKLRHPFIMALHYAFQSKSKLYLVMDFLNGGDLFYHLSKERRFQEPRARFYAAELILALEHLHKHGFIYRDLKPENVLIDAEGHVRLTDFGLSREMAQDEEIAFSFVGTTDYLAPDIIRQQGYGKEVDWWSLGVLLYEMLTGIPPFYSKNRRTTYQMILNSQLTFPPFLSQQGRALLHALLSRNTTKRLGAGPEGADAIKSHPFFAEIDWPALEAKQVPVPFKPTISSELDLGNIDEKFTRCAPVESPVNSLTNQDGTHLEAHFEGYTYVPKGFLEERTRTIELSSSDDEPEVNRPTDFDDDDFALSQAVAGLSHNSDQSASTDSQSRSQPIPMSSAGQTKADDVAFQFGMSPL